MEAYTEQKFIEMVNKQGEINFLAAAITPWHALGIDATIYNLTRQGIKLKGYIMIVSHPITGLAINENNFYMKSFADIKVIELKQEPTRRTIKEKVINKFNKYYYYIKKQKYNSENKNFYWVTPLKPSYELIPKIAIHKTNYNLKLIITDEGLGSYLNTAFIWCRHAFMEGGMKAGLKESFNLLFRDKFFLHQLEKRNQISYNQLLEKKKGKWEENKEASTAYKHILGLVEYEKDYSYYEKSVIINTEKLYESGILNDSVDITIYTEVCKAMKEASIPVILKIHPREKMKERYENLVCYKEENNEIAQENIFATIKNKPYCVLGIDSTTLITSKVLFGIEAISVIHLIDKNNLNYKKEFDKFEKTFSNLLYMPKTIKELIKDIDDIKEKYEKELI